MKTQNEIKRLHLLKNAAMAHMCAGAAKGATKVIDRMKSQVQTSGVGEEELLNALKEVAEVAKEDDTLLAIMERMVDLDPSDIKTRFSLAYKHTEVGNNDLALFHYLRIPHDERHLTAWNNLGVAFDQFDLSAKSVQAYRKSEEAGGTLAMSNLARKLMIEGFLPEAQQLCDAALKIENYHRNIPHIIAQLKEQPDEEDKKEAEILEKAKPISDFYTEYGRALSRVEPATLAKRWKGRDCSLEVTLQGSVFDARGSYELQPGSLASLLLRSSGDFASGDKPSPVRYQVEFHGSLCGCAVEGSVVRGREDERQQAQSLLSPNENEARVLMIVSDDGNEIRVMERKQGTSPKFYTLIREHAT
jgi:tetratricopeptide (TPR) repeat protein